MNKKLTASLLSIFIFALFCLTGCNPPKAVGEVYYDNDEPYEIVYYFPFTSASAQSTMRDMTLVNNALNEITMREINATVKLIAINYHEYKDRLPSIIGSGAKFDICYTSPTINHYFLNVEREVFIPLDWMIDEYAPSYKQEFDDVLRGQAKVNDKSYGMINMQILPRTDNYLVDNLDYFNAFLNDNYPAYTYSNVDNLLVDEHINALDLMAHYGEYLTYNKLGKGVGMTARAGAVNVDLGLQTRYGFDDMGTTMFVPGVVRLNDDPADGLKVINQFETNEFKESILTAASWRETGLMPSNIDTVGSNGTHLPSFDFVPNGTWKPNDIRVGSTGADAVPIKLGEPVYYTSFIIGSMNAIRSNSGNPARAMKFLNLMRTNREVANLLVYGIEDMHYEVLYEIGDTGRNKIRINKNSGYDNYQMSWAYGNEFILDISEEHPDDLWEKVKEINANSVRHPVVGFNFNPSPVAQEIANCTSEATIMLTEFSTGSFISQSATLAKLEEFKVKIKSDADKIIAEKQRQLDAWLASQ